MAGYGHTNRSNYKTYEGMEQPAYGYGNSDHVCRPVMIDAEGRKQPIICYNGPNHSEGYVTRVERIVEHVRTPIVTGTEYKYSSPTLVEPVREYGVVYDPQYRRPSSPFRERRERVEEFIPKVQTEATRPARTGLLGPTNWRNTPNSTGHNGTTGYSEYNNFNNNDHWNKPSGNTNRDDKFDDYYRNTSRDDKFDDYYRRNEAPTGPRGWTTPPSHHEKTALSRPTNNIGEAVELLKEAAIGSAVSAVPPQARFMLPSKTVPPKREAYKSENTIDSKEAARRYGNFNLASRKSKTADTY